MKRPGACELRMHLRWGRWLIKVARIEVRPVKSGDHASARRRANGWRVKTFEPSQKSTGMGLKQWKSNLWSHKFIREWVWSLCLSHWGNSDPEGGRPLHWPRHQLQHYLHKECGRIHNVLIGEGWFYHTVVDTLWSLRCIHWSFIYDMSWVSKYRYPGVIGIS